MEDKQQICFHCRELVRGAAGHPMLTNKGRTGMTTLFVCDQCGTAVCYNAALGWVVERKGEYREAWC